MNGGEFVDATIALVETKSRGSLALMGPTQRRDYETQWMATTRGRDRRKMNRPASYLTSTDYAAPRPASDTTTAAPHEANRKKKEEGII